MTLSLCALVVTGALMMGAAVVAHYRELPCRDALQRHVPDMLGQVREAPLLLLVSAFISVLPVVTGLFAANRLRPAGQAEV